MATATLYSSLLMGWRSRWCWQTRMQHTTRWCQWCRCRDSCRQARPHRRLAPPSARLVRAKTASAECFLQQDWEWCPRNRASWSRPEPRTRKRAHASWSEPCRKLWNKESYKGAASKSSSSSQKHCGVRWTPATMNIPSNEQNWSCRSSPTKMFVLQKNIPWHKSFGVHKNIPWTRDPLLEGHVSFATHAYLLFPSVPSNPLFLPQFACSSAPSGADRIPQMAGWEGCFKKK